MKEAIMEKKLGNGTVIVSLDDRGIVTVTLNRPEVNNAYNGDMLNGLHEAMDMLADVSQARVVVVKGNGKHFQAGADLAWISSVGKTGPEGNLEASRITAEAVRRLNQLPVPTIALVQGGCFGGGTGVVSACDVVIASENAVFAITEARWGLAAAIIFPQLCQAMGVRNVRRYALTCERFSAQTAKEIGLVHEVCAEGQMQAVADKIIDALLMNGPNAVMSTKLRTLDVSGSLIGDGLFDELVKEHAATRQSAEAAEGTASFLEKRLPKWYPGKGKN